MTLAIFFVIIEKEMKCSDCIIWERKRQELLYGSRVIPAACARYGWGELFREMLIYFEDKLRGHALLRDEEHRRGWCRLLDKQVIVG